MGVISEEGRGAVFWFEILVKKSKKMADAYSYSDLKGGKVLIADENKTSQAMLTKQLVVWG